MIDPARILAAPEADPLRTPVVVVAMGPSFAALLGDAAAGGGKPPVPIRAADPFPPAATIAPHGSPAGMPDDDEARRGVASAARMFNQDGLFAHAVTFAAQPVDVISTPEVIVRLPSIPARVGAPLCMPVAVPAATAAAPVARDPAPMPPVVVRPPARIVSLPQVPVDPPPFRSTAPVEVRNDGRIPPSNPVRRVRPTAAVAPVAVAVHAVGHGLEVVARLEALDPDERTRVADEIAALLARHGHAPGRIAVLARPILQRNL